MEEHAVHARTEHQVEVRFHLRKRCAEVLREPCERLTRRQRLPCDVSCRRRIFQHRQVGIVLTSHAWVTAQSFNAEVREPKAFNLWNVNRRIAVDEVCRRAVSLIAGDGAVCMCPCRPLLGEVLKEQVGKRFAVVGDGPPVVPRGGHYTLLGYCCTFGGCGV